MSKLILKKDMETNSIVLVTEDNTYKSISDVDLDSFAKEDEITLIIEPWHAKTDDEDVFDCDIENLLNYITNNNCRINLRIFTGSDINNYFEDFDFEEKLYNKREYIKNKDMVSFELYPLGKKIKYTQFEEIKDDLDKRIEDISAKAKDLSQIEKIAVGFMFSAYSFLDSRYDAKSEEKKDDGERNLDKATFDVYTANVYRNETRPQCQIFAYLLEKFLKKNNMSYEGRTLSTKNGYHAVDVVEVNDDKYNIHGKYLFDPTFCHDVIDSVVKTAAIDRAEGKEAKDLEEYPRIIPVAFCVGLGIYLETYCKYKGIDLEVNDDLLYWHLGQKINNFRPDLIASLAYSAVWGDQKIVDIAYASHIDTDEEQKNVIVKK